VGEIWVALEMKMKRKKRCFIISGVDVELEWK
jgi:hypothetical protein